MTTASAKYMRAVALLYDQRRDAAPSVSAKGLQFEADSIVRIAQRFGVPVVESPELAKSLSALEVDSSIPSSLFEAVAIILAKLETLSSIKRPRDKI